MKGKISIIISVFNNSEHLLKCLTSINNQSLLPDEVILTDDGSAEDIRQIILGRIDLYNFKITFCQQADLGFRVARCKNNGLRVAQSEIIIFFDQDIITTKNYLETTIKHLTKQNFVVSLPIRTTSEQLSQLTESKISNFNYEGIFTDQQIKKVISQYRKEQLYSFLHRFRLRKNGVKLRGGCFGIYRENLLKINGFDENFISWGNEDDDLGKRLSNIGVKGYYPYRKEYSTHLYHLEYHDGTRKNKEYYEQNKDKYLNGYFFSEYGVSNTKDDDQVTVEVLKP